MSISIEDYYMSSRVIGLPKEGPDLGTSEDLRDRPRYEWVKLKTCRYTMVAGVCRSDLRSGGLNPISFWGVEGRYTDVRSRIDIQVDQDLKKLPRSSYASSTLCIYHPHPHYLPYRDYMPRELQYRACRTDCESRLSAEEDFGIMSTTGV